MAHHYSDDDPEMQKRLVHALFKDVPRLDPMAPLRQLAAETIADEPLGATGRYPEGKYTDRDEGEIRFAVAADRERGKVLLDFGKPVRSVGMTPRQAREFAEMLCAKADLCEGKVAVVTLGEDAAK